MPAVAIAPTAALGSACEATPPAGSLRVTLNSAGETRYARVYVPRAPAGQPLPLVLAFPGAGATGSFMQRYSGLSRVAAQHRIIVANPTAYGTHPFWSLNDSARNGPQSKRRGST